jgi:tRNA nucleotidyltransferase/poly(A) polymerase
VSASILLGVTTAAAHEGSKPPCLREDALAVLTRLREAGHVAYFAGGCVRDELLGLTPKDYDVATDAPPDRVRQLFSNTQAVGAAFGVILVRHGKSVVEVATFRTDGKYVDGRRPEAVTFTTAEEDAKRRDFTINGLFLDPLKDATIDRQVIDYVGGLDDLVSRTIRAIGDPDRRFEEDHLRLLRAVRFYAKYGREMEEQTDAAIRRHAPQLARISPERVGEELRLMLTGPKRYVAWDYLMDTGLAGVILRFVPWRADEEEFRRSKGHLFEFMLKGEPIGFGAALAAAVVEYRRAAAPDGTEGRWLFERKTVREMVHALRQSAKITNEESDEMAGTLEGLAPLLADQQPSVATLKRFLARPTSRYSRGLLRAMESMSYVDAARFTWLESQFAALEGTDVAPPPLVTGDDLTDAGLNPGPRFKVALDQTYDAQLEGRVTTRHDAMEMAVRIAKGGTG